MIIPGATPCYPDATQGFHIYGGTEEPLSSSSIHIAISGSQTNPTNTLLYNLSILKDKVQQVESIVSLVVSPTLIQQDDDVAMAINGAGSLIQEIIVTATSMVHAFQRLAMNYHIKASSNEDGSSHVYCEEAMNPAVQSSDGNWRTFLSGKSQEGYNSDLNCHTGTRMDFLNKKTNSSSSNKNNDEMVELDHDVGINRGEFHNFSSSENDIIELNASDLLAKFTHYCQICGKGFKRNANLRMHMRAHGDEYKTNAALSNPLKKTSNTMDYKDCSMVNIPKKYSCPQEGCRWNKKHANFQPLKSMICVKNHYRRIHCPKMYVCNRCNRKQFSVLSDLRTHEKHCGDLKWQCSCGTTFSRKDKLMGHLSLFIGHTPAIDCFAKQDNVNHPTSTQVRVEGS